MTCSSTISTTHSFKYFITIIKMSGQITLNINGEFLTQRIQELEEEIERYKSGVSELEAKLDFM